MEYRLEGFTIQLLDAKRKKVFEMKGVRAGESILITMGKRPKASYLTYSGKRGKRAAISRMHRFGRDEIETLLPRG